MAKHSAEAKTTTQKANDRTYRVNAPKCPHGHFMRYAVNNCKKGCKK